LLVYAADVPVINVMLHVCDNLRHDRDTANIVECGYVSLVQ